MGKVCCCCLDVPAQAWPAAMLSAETPGFGGMPQQAFQPVQVVCGGGSANMTWHSAAILLCGSVIAVVWVRRAPLACERPCAPLFASLVGVRRSQIRNSFGQGDQWSCTPLACATLHVCCRGNGNKPPAYSCKLLWLHLHVPVFGLATHVCVLL